MIYYSIYLFFNYLWLIIFLFLTFQKFPKESLNMMFSLVKSLILRFYKEHRITNKKAEQIIFFKNLFFHDKFVR